MPRPDALRAGAAVIAAALALTALSCRPRDRDRPTTTHGPTTTDRADGVAEHSRHVMPFDLTRSTHAFDPVPDGLDQTVVTLEPVDPAQVEAIRAHLRHEAGRFRAGDFSDPAHIHGGDMPGLDELRAGADRLVITYEDVPAGGRLTYRSEDPALVDALHRWGEAQVADHGHGPAHG